MQRRVPGAARLPGTTYHQPDTMTTCYVCPSIAADRPLPASVHLLQNRYSSPLPIHAYGELVRTERGCRFLETSGMLAALLAR